MKRLLLVAPAVIGAVTFIGIAWLLCVAKDMLRG